MSHTPPELAEEFPNPVERMHELKAQDAHFRKLMGDYDEVNLAIHRAETNLRPTDDLHETELRKTRLSDVISDDLGEADPRALAFSCAFVARNQRPQG